MSRRLAWLGTVALVALSAAGGARAADVNVTADDYTGINLDAETGSTVEISPGVTVTNAPFSQPISATTSAWALTNRGSVNSTSANAISLSVADSSLINSSSIVAGSFSNAIWMTGGGSVDNKAGATISANQTGIKIGTAPAGWSQASVPAPSSMPGRSPRPERPAILSRCFSAARSPTSHVALVEAGIDMR